MFNTSPRLNLRFCSDLFWLDRTSLIHLLVINCQGNLFPLLQQTIIASYLAPTFETMLSSHSWTLHPFFLLTSVLVILPCCR